LTVRIKAGQGIRKREEKRPSQCDTARKEKRKKNVPLPRPAKPEKETSPQPEKPWQTKRFCLCVISGIKRTFKRKKGRRGLRPTPLKKTRGKRKKPSSKTEPSKRRDEEGSLGERKSERQKEKLSSLIQAKEKKRTTYLPSPGRFPGPKKVAGLSLYHAERCGDMKSHLHFLHYQLILHNFQRRKNIRQEC